MGFFALQATLAEGQHGNPLGRANLAFLLLALYPRPHPKHRVNLCRQMHTEDLATKAVTVALRRIKKPELLLAYLMG